MKKYLIFVIGILSFLGINTVKADTITYTIDLLNTNYSYEENINFYNDNKSIFIELFDGVYDYYIENYKDLYPYYSVSLRSGTGCVKDCEEDKLYIYMYMYDTLPTITFGQDILTHYLNANLVIEYSYDLSAKSYILPIIESIMSNKFPIGIDYFYSNFYLKMYLDGYDSLSLNTNPSSDILKSFYNDNVFPTIQSLFSLDLIFDPDVADSTFVEINLNDYEYVALSLKDYSVTEQFYTNVYVKGNYCLTPVYNYGMNEKVDYYSGYQVDRCSPYYEEYTLVRTYILGQDLENHAIYYLKAYDTSKENLVKVDTSVFDITYITSENKDDPYVTVNGKTYPTIPYDNLSSSSTKSEDEDYISGVSCQVGDFNCYTEYNPSNVFDELFDKPLEMLKSVWSAIISIFALITEFILLLPDTMQGFLYVAFGISIILGIIKIIL